MEGKLITAKVWDVITAACKHTNRRSYVAVAYFGTGGAARLPLRRGSVLVVDASVATVKLGLTNPSELIKLCIDGVKIYSKPDLHAKVYVIGTKAFIGSANVSAHSADDLHEAVFYSSIKTIVHQARDYVDEMADKLVPLGIKKLELLEKKYKTPRFQRKVKNNSADSTEPNGYVVRLRYMHNYSVGHENAVEKGKAEANQNALNPTSYITDEFQWKGNTQIKPDDYVIMVTEEWNGFLVSPIARVLSVQKWGNNKHAIIFVEHENLRRRKVESINKLIGGSFLKRSGKKRTEDIDMFKKIWDKK